MPPQSPTDHTTIGYTKLTSSDHPGMDTLIREYLAHIRAGGYSRHTLQDRQELLVRLDRDLPYGIGTVATEDLERWLGALGCSPPSWTLCTYFTAIRAFYGWATKTHRLDFDPSGDL